MHSLLIKLCKNMSRHNFINNLSSATCFGFCKPIFWKSVLCPFSECDSPENGDITLLQNFGNYVPVDTAYNISVVEDQNHQKHCCENLNFLVWQKKFNSLTRPQVKGWGGTSSHIISSADGNGSSFHNLFIISDSGQSVETPQY